MSIMSGFVAGWIQDTFSNLASTGLKAVGGYAGNAICGIGDVVERSGQTVGNGKFQLVDDLSRDSGLTMSATELRPDKEVQCCRKEAERCWRAEQACIAHPSDGEPKDSTSIK